MKRLNLITLLLLTTFSMLCAQNINWASLNENQEQIAYLNFGYDYGITTQVGYGYKFNTARPILLRSDFSVPMGNKVFDDFKFRIGGQVQIIDKNKWSLSAKLNSVIKRYQTKLVRLVNLGSQISITGGYYKPNWHLAGEFGFDKFIRTHSKHAEIMRVDFPAISDGWYSETGGQFFFGLEGSRSIGQKLDFTFRTGAINAQKKDANALLPLYLQIGLNYSFSNKGED